MKAIQIGIIGFGTIGTGVVKNLKKNASLLSERLGAQIKIKGIADIDIKKKRSVSVPQSLLTKDAHKLLNDPDIDIIVELVGGYEPAKSFILKALKNGKHIVTANKALLAVHGKELAAAAEKAGRSIFYEASVAGGIPIIKALREGFVGNNISSIFGIVNGTANYILTKMTKDGSEFSETLKEAQEKGYAESDPTFDVEGDDSAHKLAILARLASGYWIDYKDIYIEGISEITEKDIEYAGELGCVIKLLAIMKEKDNKIEARVHPTLIAKDNLLSTINGVYNAVCVEGDVVGKTMFYGKGAGEDPTASAVISDIVDIARNILNNAPARIPSFTTVKKIKGVKKIDEFESRAYLRVSALDRPSVLAKIAGVLGKYEISISSVMQKERNVKGGTVPVLMLTHKAKERNLKNALKELDRLSVIKSKTIMIRMED
ncbi:MAG: homoserine dehydrogenase [Candidatus Ancaeobacter aquaticus]|nr:homoserine dehydrogenase [Candidatus Ancaeobacter aquaticus]